jgi:hypothetical protein
MKSFPMLEVRAMARRVKLKIGGHTITAELLDTKAPKVARAFADCLPCESFSTHAKFAGEELIIMVPVYCNAENEILNVKAGDIGFYPGRQTICIFYGDVTPFGKVSVFAKVVDGLPALKQVGQKILKSGPVKASMALA